MRMNKLSIGFDYGEMRGCFKVTIDADYPLNLLQAQEIPPLEDFFGKIRQALDEPIGSLPLKDIVKPGEQILIIISDITRPVKSEQYMPILVDYLNKAGIEDKDIKILVATGSHREATKEEIGRLLGHELAGRLHVLSNRAGVVEDFVDLGMTTRGTPVKINRLAVQADHVIMTGGIGFHFLAGFSGGRKSILPGIVAQESIQANHSLVLDARGKVRQGLMDGNPIAEDMWEAAAMLNPSFLLNVVLNDRGEPAGVFAGDWNKAHRAGCRFANSCFGISVEEKRPLVIAGAGGFPKDLNLYQSAKGLLNAMEVVAEGGTVIFVAECREGIGAEDYFALAAINQTQQEKEDLLRRKFSIARYIGYLNSLWANKATIKLVSKLPKDQVQAMGMEPYASLEEAMAEVDARALNNCWLIPRGADIAII
jgi:nickel-dependent lactate racemase